MSNQKLYKAQVGHLWFCRCLISWWLDGSPNKKGQSTPPSPPGNTFGRSACRTWAFLQWFTCPTPWVCGFNCVVRCKCFISNTLIFLFNWLLFKVWIFTSKIPCVSYVGSRLSGNPGIYVPCRAVIFNVGTDGWLSSLSDGEWEIWWTAVFEVSILWWSPGGRKWGLDGDWSQFWHQEKLKCYFLHYLPKSAKYAKICNFELIIQIFPNETGKAIWNVGKKCTFLHFLHFNWSLTFFFLSPEHSKW